ncbi:MAG: flippase activity-associated protein Agl23 [Chloroflexota bacterium]
MNATPEDRVSWLDKPVITNKSLNYETGIFIIILILAIFSRFYDLGTRVMSHDESLHTYFSWNLYRGNGFQHTPMMHGPLQFHLVALSYFLFGDNDFTSRIPAAVASIITVLFLWKFRRYLGRTGTLITAFLALISPYMLYYGRYVRNEAFVALLGLATIWVILRHLETGETRYIYWLTVVTVLHFTTKETAFIYTAQAMLFLGILFIQRMLQHEWKYVAHRRGFSYALVATLLFVLVAAGFGLYGHHMNILSPTETAAPAIPGEELATTFRVSPGPVLLFFALAVMTLLIALTFIVTGLSWDTLRNDRAFSMLLLLMTFSLPQLAPFPVKWMGWDPLDYSTQGMIHTATALIPMTLIAIALGIAWKPRLWFTNAAIFLVIYTVLYTTTFTNGAGFFSGLVGSLGYWLEQQGVHRGSQPWYYYILVQIPAYEYLPACACILALYYGIKRWVKGSQGYVQTPTETAALNDFETGEERAPAIPLIAYWSVTSLLAFTIAGEKMPWLSVHIALPFILLGGWGLGKLVDSIDWKVVRSRRGILILLLLPVFFLGVFAVFSSLLGAHPPFQGKELNQLQDTSTFITALLTSLLSGWGLVQLLKEFNRHQVHRLAGVTFFAFLGVLTIHTSILASYLKYDEATEFLVYAHSARGVKEVMAQVEDISRRTTDGLALAVAYDNDVAWPFTWYLRNYYNQRYYAENPDYTLRDSPIIIVGDNNFGKIEPVVAQGFYRFDYIRMWWPDQTYFNLTWERILNALADPLMREALFKIWLNRDYSTFAELKGRDMSLPNWSPSDKMRMYIRKDVAAQIWNFGIGPTVEDIFVDPYEGKSVVLSAEKMIGSQGSEPGQFRAPRGIAIAPDGSLYVADTNNHRIQHLSPDGEVLHVWGSFADISKGLAPPGTFYEPWGLAVDLHGNVYVADTWNHRIQKFTPDGQFLLMWGYFGQGETPDAFWGPRDVAIDSQGRVFVADTGNKRIVIFDQAGKYIAQIGSGGMAPGQFAEPVGIALDAQDRLYVADTWNQRLQVLVPSIDNTYLPELQWEIFGWYGQSLDNKPYLAVNHQGHIFVTDPEGYRVLEFDAQGEMVRLWGGFGLTENTFGLAAGIEVDSMGGIWVTDAGNHRLMYFSIP